MSWADGYVSEIGYTYGYYPDLGPGLLRLACLSAGVAPPPPGPLNYLELGYGQGVSINIHAATIGGQFWGTDFNPAQAAHARSLADASNSGAVLLDDSFVDLAARTDLPEFDVIGLHGTWSWVSDDSRRAIVDIIRRRLRPGGIVYLSYNCSPGWAHAIPLRHLMALHAEVAGGEGGGIVNKINAALAFSQRVVDAGAFHFRINTRAADWLKTIQGQDRAYLAHEYFNRDWAVMPFSEVARWLNDAKLSFVATSRLIDHVDSVSLTPEWQTLLAEQTNPVMKQSVRDYLLNQQFRRDVFVKGPRPLSAVDRLEAWRAQPFILTNHPDDIAMKTGGAMGEITLQEPMFRPVIEILAQKSYAPKTVGELVSHPKLQGRPIEDIISALLILVSDGNAHPAQPVTKVQRERSDALNMHICRRARGGRQLNFLASPVTGSGIGADQFQQLFLLALDEGKKTIAEQAAFAWAALLGQGQALLKAGKVLATAEENIAELSRHATVFAEKRLPLLKALGIA